MDLFEVQNETPLHRWFFFALPFVVWYMNRRFRAVVQLDISIVNLLLLEKIPNSYKIIITNLLAQKSKETAFICCCCCCTFFFSFQTGFFSSTRMNDKLAAVRIYSLAKYDTHAGSHAHKITIK